VGYSERSVGHSEGSVGLTVWFSYLATMN
jgi:hypothetical protein